MAGIQMNKGKDSEMNCFLKILKFLDNKTIHSFAEVSYLSEYPYFSFPYPTTIVVVEIIRGGNG
jgi:hypothetical protein